MDAMTAGRIDADQHLGRAFHEPDFVRLRLVIRNIVLYFQFGLHSTSMFQINQEVAAVTIETN
jgi:hypothetical protein